MGGGAIELARRRERGYVVPNWICFDICKLRARAERIVRDEVDVIQGSDRVKKRSEGFAVGELNSLNSFQMLARMDSDSEVDGSSLAFL
jgi:hypothetical protein